MDNFSIRDAWARGLGFLTGRLAQHLLILLGLGILPAYGLPLLIGAPDPGSAAPGSLAIAAERGGAAAAIFVLGLGYALQTGSYFACWRRGLSREGSLPGAIGFGLVAGLVAALIFAALLVAASFAASMIGAVGAWLLGGLIVLIPVVLVFALFYTVLSAMLGLGLSVLLTVAMLFGAATGNIGFAATLAGGSGMVVVVLVVMGVVLLWLAARFSCAASIMAERRSFNPVAAMRESWALTLDEQWPIVRYLALIAFSVWLIIIAIAIAAGAGVATLIEGAAMPEGRLTEAVVGIAVALPLALLTIMIPAGIYRELAQNAETAEVFA